MAPAASPGAPLVIPRSPDRPCSISTQAEREVCVSVTSLIASYLKMQSQGTRLAPSVPPARPRARACGRRVRLHRDGRSSAESSNGNASAWRGEQELRPRQHPSEEQSWSGLRSGSTLSASVRARLGADLRQWELHAAVARLSDGERGGFAQPRGMDRLHSHAGRARAWRGADSGSGHSL